jgi:hypothetical protein
MPSIRRWHLLVLLVALAVSSAGTARALSITGIAVATDAANTANASTTTGANRFQIASSVGLVGAAPAPVADVVGASLAFDTRYAALLAVDREAGGGSHNRSATAAYTITFTVDNPLGGTYRIDVDTSRLGALTLVTDSGGSATASLSAVTGSLDGVVDPALALSAAGPLTGAAGGNTAFSQTSTTLSVLSSAPLQTYTLAFSWTASATGNQDEAAVRLGIGGSLGSVTADDYPGVGARVASNDGHFVHVGVTLLTVPEPASLTLALCGLAWMAARRAPRPRRH